MQKIDVLVLAGGTLPDDLKKHSAGYDNRALLKIGDKYMIEYVIDALSGVSGTGRILVVGLQDPLEQVLGDRVDKVLASKDSMLENIRLGLDFFSDSERLIISSCDIPLIVPETVERFIEACNNIKGDVYYPIVEKKFNDQKYPATKRTYFKLRDGMFTGGNIVMLNPAAIRENWDLLEQAIAARKSPGKLLGMIGLGFIILYLFHRLTTEMLEKKMESIVGMRCKSVQVTDPEIGVDVDKESDYLLVKEQLEHTEKKV